MPCCKRWCIKQFSYAQALQRNVAQLLGRGFPILLVYMLPIYAFFNFIFWKNHHLLKATLHLKPHYFTLVFHFLLDISYLRFKNIIPCERSAKSVMTQNIHRIECENIFLFFFLLILNFVLIIDSLSKKFIGNAKNCCQIMYLCAFQ